MDDMYITLEAFEEAKEYWLGVLSGDLSETRPGIDFPGTGSRLPAEYTAVFEDRLNQKLLWLSKDNDLSLYVILLTALNILIFKITGNRDIIVGSPIFGSSDQDYNKWIALRNFPDYRTSFKEFLFQVKECVAGGYEKQYYPIRKLIKFLGLKDRVSLFRVILLLENIHDKSFFNDICEDFENDIMFAFRKEEDKLQGEIIYNASLFKTGAVERLFEYYCNILTRALDNLDIKIMDLDLMTGKEKSRVLYAFNRTGMEVPGDKTLHLLFEEQVEKTPGHCALTLEVDTRGIYNHLESSKAGYTPSLLREYEACCFKCNPFLFRFPAGNPLAARLLKTIGSGDAGGMVLVRTHREDYLLVDRYTLCLLDALDGKRNLKSIFAGLRDGGFTFVIFPIDTDEWVVGARESYRVEDDFTLLVFLVRVLHCFHLIQLADVCPGAADTAGERFTFEAFPAVEDSRAGEVVGGKEEKTEKGFRGGLGPVLLLGDDAGTGTTGLLYLAGYLRRNGVEAYCRWNDPSRTAVDLKKSLGEMLSRVHPRYVGISMKWFPHMARAMEMCKIVKDYDPSIQVIVGGNTASYFSEDIIGSSYVDYVVRGDGEVPLLKICRGESVIPNCVYKRNGKIVRQPIRYVQDGENVPEVFLSHLDEIFVSPEDPFRASSFYINTAKGCSFQCTYCAGCREMMEHTFGRSRPFLRGVSEVRGDISAAKNYTCKFMFDSYNLFDDMVAYYEKVWDGIDLSGYFCEFYCWELPAPAFIELVTRTFKYVTFQIDTAGFSEAHRQKLVSLGLVKPQPSNDALFSFLDRCEGYANAEVIINQVAGLPYFTLEDIRVSEGVITDILRRYRVFRRLDWGRLHAQPGAPIVRDCGRHNMYTCAGTFEEFMHYSQLNLEEEKYPGLAALHYPFIYFNDDNLNSRISKYYFDTNKKIEQARGRQENRGGITREITYGELNREAGQVACRLRERGVIPGTVVGVMIKPSIEMAAVILGILKAGGAFLPIEMDYPEERKKYILADSNAGVLVTESGELSEVSGDVERNEGVSPAHPCYVIYTSGTTGRSKGVVVEHRNAVNTLLCRKAEYGMNETHTALQLFSYAFDGFITSFFTPLISGSRVVLAGENHARDIPAITRVIRENRVTHFICVPQLYRPIIENLSPADAASLQVVTLAGDKLSPGLLEITARKNKHLEIVNEYGVTEAAVMSSIHRHQERTRDIHIGKPVWNTRFYVVNRYRQPQPPGIAGELWIAGAGVACGYLNDPELTAEKFDRDSWDFQDYRDEEEKETGERINRSYRSYRSYSSKKIYKTGDLARWLPDGNIEFLGRMDNQVKIRGKRVSLAEIEERLNTHPAVKDAVVTVRQDAAGDGYLCAYLVLAGDAGKVEDRWRDYLAGELPDYMIPSYYINLEAIPLTPGGKVDRNALPEPGTLKTKGLCEAPRDERERKLVQIWQEVLGVEEVGINHNFFELGGHSLKAIKVISRIHQELDVRVSIDKFFEIPFIKGLSAYLGEMGEEKHVPVVPVEKKEYYPASPAQKRLYILHQVEGNPTHYSAPVPVVLEGPADTRRLEKAFEEMVKRHETLCTSFHLIHDRLVQRVHDKVEFKIEGIGAVVEDFIRPFDLSRAPLLRVGLKRLEEEKHLLITDMHHIISDAVSIRVFVHEFTRLYEGKELPPLNLHYKDYSQWQEGLPGSEHMKKQEAYWLDRFKGKIPCLELPTDFPRPRQQQFDGRTYFFAVPKEDGSALKQLTLREDTTLQITLLTIFYILLYKITGQEDIVVGTPTAGRRHADLEHIIGVFINSLALRCYPSPEKTVGQFLAEVKENTLDAFENQDYPFDNLVEKILTRRAADRNPLFDVMFEISHPEDMEPANMEGLKISPYEDENKVARYDLDWVGEETDAGLQFSVTFRTTLFRLETIETFAAWFGEILHQVVEDNTIRLQDITLSHDYTVTETTVFKEAHGDFEFI